MNHFATIVADPPWPYKTPGQIGASLEHRPNRDKTLGAGNAGSRSRYGAMEVADLCALRIPAADAAHLYLWFTNTFGAEAHQIAQAWGFRPMTILTYVKVKPDGTPSMKMGYYFRGATEHVLFAVRGSLRLRAQRALPTAYLWPRLPHSVKPDAFYDLVEEASHPPYLELFARRTRLGWSSWGDEVPTDLLMHPHTESATRRGDAPVVAESERGRGESPSSAPGRGIPTSITAANDRTRTEG